MTRCLLILLLLISAAPPAVAQSLGGWDRIVRSREPVPPPKELPIPLRREAPLLAAPASRLCRPAIEAAERRHGVPSRLLAAIARVESGRADPVTGEVGPWPWTINVEGQGFYFDTKAQAIAAVNAHRARGARSIDVGCMQVNLVHHPNAFAGLEQAFDPASNADYAARFLVRLNGQTGSWEKATAWYHSATPELGGAYQRRVAMAWPEEQKRPAPGVVPGTSLAAAWGATIRRDGHPILGHAGHGRIIPLANGPAMGGAASGGAGGAPTAVGRGLDAYRAMPITWAFRPPPPPVPTRRAGG